MSADPFRPVQAGTTRLTGPTWTAPHDRELRELAAGDDHARRQLAGWLAERALSARLPGRVRLEEVIEVICLLADAGDDVAELWLVRWLADCDRLDELRQCADSDSYH